MSNGEGKLILGPEDMGMTPMQERRLNVQRAPIEIICTCGYKNTIVLPSGKGLLLWYCHKCGQAWQFKFGEKGGELSKAI